MSGANGNSDTISKRQVRVLLALMGALMMLIGGVAGAVYQTTQNAMDDVRIDCQDQIGRLERQIEARQTYISETCSREIANVREHWMEALTGCREYWSVQLESCRELLGQQLNSR